MPYPLSKIDFVAARSFSVGGMENWGLIIFQNEMFLLDSLLESKSTTLKLSARQEGCLHNMLNTALKLHSFMVLGVHVESSIVQTKNSSL